LGCCNPGAVSPPPESNHFEVARREASECRVEHIVVPARIHRTATFSVKPLVSVETSTPIYEKGIAWRDSVK